KRSKTEGQAREPLNAGRGTERPPVSPAASLFLLGGVSQALDHESARFPTTRFGGAVPPTRTCGAFTRDSVAAGSRPESRMPLKPNHPVVTTAARSLTIAVEVATAHELMACGRIIPRT